MFHLKTLARTIHADRIRDMERAAHDRRLLAPDDEAVAAAGPVVVRSTRTRPTNGGLIPGGSVTRPAPCDGSAGIPA